MATEVELKLAARRRDLPALVRALTARAGDSGTRRHLVGTYFDTPDLALRRSGLVLRVRQRDGEFVQTVKSDDAGSGASALARGEWEDQIASAMPDPLAPVSGRFLDPDIALQLVPLFRTEVRRQTIEFSPTQETRVEAAIDRGHIAVPAAAKREPVCEIELELKQGPATVLYDIALHLLAVAPLRLERRSKAERGYRLAAPDACPVKAAHATALDLDPQLSGEEVLRRIGIACLDQIMRNQDAVQVGMVEGIHQMRVAVRRLRAVLSAFGRLLPPDRWRWASDELRWLAQALGPARNLAVFEEALLTPAERALGANAALTALGAAAERRRKRAYANAAQAVRSIRYTGLLLRLLRWFEGFGWREDGAAQPDLKAPIATIAGPILDRRRRVVRRRSKGFADQSRKKRHALRIALKKLRYAAEPLAPLYDAADVDRFAKRLKRLQDDLGDANDLLVAQDIVAELTRGNGAAKPIAAAGAAVIDWRGRRLAHREPRLRRDLQRLLDAAPFWAG